MGGEQRFKADALRAIAERLQDRPVEFLPDFAPGDYGPELTYDRAWEVALELLAELGELADLVEAGADGFTEVRGAYWSDPDERVVLLELRHEDEPSALEQLAERKGWRKLYRRMGR